MSNAADNVARHYSSGSLLQRLNAALISDGVDPHNPSLLALAPYDHFHGRGLEATEGLAAGLDISASDHILDVGSGFGGPARFFADRFGCRVTGLDLTEEFCEVAVHLNKLLKLDAQVAIKHGNALSMPFADQSFDGAYSMNVSMNIEDKAALYRELHRVLKPNGWLVLSEAARGADGPIDFPTPWANSATTSFLATPQQTRVALDECGFEVVREQDTRAESTAYGARSRELVKQGEKPLHRAVTLVHGEQAKVAMENSARAITQGIIIPIEIYSVRRAG